MILTSLTTNTHMGERGALAEASGHCALSWLVQNKSSAPIRLVENKVEFLER